MSKEDVNRIWKHIGINDVWLKSDTSILDDIKESWFARRELLKDKSKEYEEFLLKLKREHAIETGIVERIYDLRKGITETFIKEGFVESYLSHGDTNIPKDDLMSYLRDHLEAVDFVFDVVKNNRPLTTGFIKELHHLVTNSQKYAEGRDQFGNKTKIPLIKGKYKERENNPTRKDGVKILYCPPDHVSSEMDNLITIYEDLVTKKVHPLIIASWFHHAFTTIHPFQDGNGRVARLLASLVFIKFGFFPFTVLRDEAKVKYIKSLEDSDNGNPEKLINYFGEVQKRNIQKALNIKEVSSESLEEVQEIFLEKLEKWKTKPSKQREAIISESRKEIFEYCNIVLSEIAEKLSEQLNGNAAIILDNCAFRNDKIDLNGNRLQDRFVKQTQKYSDEHNYYFNLSLPKSWLTFEIVLSKFKQYQIVLSIHHYGYDSSTLAIGGFLELNTSANLQIDDTQLPLKIIPHVVSVINNNIETKKKNIRHYLEKVLAKSIAQIASEI